MIAKEGRDPLVAQLPFNERHHIAEAHSLFLYIVGENLSNVSARLSCGEQEEAVCTACVVVLDGVQILPAFTNDDRIRTNLLGCLRQPGQERNVL